MLTDRQIKLVVGSLLHDIGKVVYRSGDGRNHSTSGYDFLKNEAKIEDAELLNCVRYHHGKYLKNAQIAADDLAYITYYADNVAALRIVGRLLSRRMDLTKPFRWTVYLTY